MALAMRVDIGEDSSGSGLSADDARADDALSLFSSHKFHFGELSHVGVQASVEVFWSVDGNIKFNILRPRQNFRYFAGAIFKSIFLSDFFS